MVWTPSKSGTDFIIVHPSRSDFGVVPFNVLLQHILSFKTTMQVAEWTAPRSHASLVFVRITLGTFKDRPICLKAKYEPYFQWLIRKSSGFSRYAEQTASMHKCSPQITQEKRELTGLLHPQ
jgi:hypothetical protein